MVNKEMKTWIMLLLVSKKDEPNSPLHVKVEAETAQDAVEALGNYSWEGHWVAEKGRSVRIVQIDDVTKMRDITPVVIKRKRRKRVRS